MLKDLTHEVTFLPGSEKQLSEMVGRLREELSEHFSFAPKSTARLEEVLLGTLGMPNGRQQWQSLLNRPIVDSNLKNQLLELLTTRIASPDIKALVHHEDRQVRAMMQSLVGLAEETLVITFGYADLEGLQYGEHLSRLEAKACFRYAQRHLDADQGMNWEGLEDAAYAIFHQRVFYPRGYKGEHGIRFYQSYERTEPNAPSGWYDEAGQKYELYLPDEGEDEEPVLVGPDDEDVDGLWKQLAR